MAVAAGMVQAAQPHKVKNMRIAITVTGPGLYEEEYPCTVQQATLTVEEMQVYPTWGTVFMGVAAPATAPMLYTVPGVVESVHAHLLALGCPAEYLIGFEPSEQGAQVGQSMEWDCDRPLADWLAALGVAGEYEYE